jgi:hypothetical protein
MGIVRRSGAVDDEFGSRTAFNLVNGQRHLNVHRGHAVLVESFVEFVNALKREFKFHAGLIEHDERFLTSRVLLRDTI